MKTHVSKQKESEQGSVQKVVTFPSGFYTLAETRANEFGLSFHDYLKILVFNDVKVKVDAIPVVDEEAEERLGESALDFETGQYTTVKAGDKKSLNKVLGLKV